MQEILLHKYEVCSLIGSGGMGKVYLARDLNLDRPVVLKESRTEFLLAEIELLKELEHPGLPGIYDCFRQEESTFLVMEYIEGMSLRQYLERYKRVPEAQALKWTGELCSILSYLHSRHPAVIYRDLKPENIMIRQDGRLKLIDFGGALRCEKGSADQELCIGTAGYSPPEQWQNARGDVTWDVYGLGAVLHEMLTGANPAHPPCERRPVGEYDRSLPAALDKVIRKCTAPESGGRYQSVEELWRELEGIGAANPFLRGLYLCRKILILLCSGITAFCFIRPLLRGIPEEQFPFPYLERPLFSLMFTLLMYLVLSGRRKNKQYLLRQEKNIWLTRKPFSGLLSVLLSLTAGLLLFPTLCANTASACAEEEGTALWVEMRDDQGRKLLLKNDAVYATDTSVRFELPAKRLPCQGLDVRIVAVGEDGNVYNSRVFRIRVRED